MNWLVNRKTPPKLRVYPCIIGQVKGMFVSFMSYVCISSFIVQSLLSKLYYNFLNQGLTDREEGDLGPVYGFQWRHFGAEYKTMHSDYSGQGVDQLNNVIHKIKTDPNCRRIIMSAWNPVGKNYGMLV